MAEKDKLLRELDSCRQQLNLDQDVVLNVEDEVTEMRARKEEEIKVCGLCYSIKIKVMVLCPAQQWESYWDMPTAPELVGIKPTQR